LDVAAARKPDETPMVTRPLSGEGEGGMHRIQSEKRKKKNKNKEINKSLLFLSLSDLSHKPLSAAERVSKARANSVDIAR